MRIVVAASAVLLAVTLAGCGGDDSDDSAQDATPSEQSTGSTDTGTGSDTAAPESADPSEGADPGEAAGTDAASGPGPCDLVSTDEVAAAFATPVEEGSQGFGGHSENDVEYSSVNCSWEAEDQLEVQLELSFADDFEQGFTCLTVSYLGEEGKPVTVAGAGEASWLASEDPNEIEASLRACTDSAVITINVDAENGSEVPALKKASMTVAEQALANLA